MCFECRIGSGSGSRDGAAGRCFTNSVATSVMCPNAEGWGDRSGKQWMYMQRQYLTGHGRGQLGSRQDVQAGLELERRGMTRPGSGWIGGEASSTRRVSEGSEAYGRQLGCFCSPGHDGSRHSGEGQVQGIASRSLRPASEW